MSSPWIRRTERLTAAVIQHRWATLAVLTLITGASMVGVPQLEIDVSVESFLDADDPDSVTLRAMIDRMGSGVPLILAYEDPELFTPAGLERLAQITGEISEVEHVSRADSLTTANLVLSEDDAVVVQPLVRDLPETQAEADAIRARALGHRNIRGNLVGGDGKVAAVAVFLQYEHGKDDENAPLVVRGVRRAAEAHLGERYEWHLAGLTAFYEKMIQYVQRDVTMLALAPVLLMTLLLGFILRSFAGVVLPLAVAGLSLLWTLGLMAAMGETVGVTMVLLPPLVLVMGCADAVHIVAQVQEERRAHPELDRRSLVIRGLGRVGLAVLVTSVTTIAGFSSLSVSQVTTVRQFGLFACVAIAIALVLSATLVPIALSMLPGRATSSGTSKPGGDWLDRVLETTSRLVRRHPAWVIGIWVVLTVAAVAGMPRMRVEAGFRDQFRPDSPIVQSLDFVEERLTGSQLLAVYVEGSEPGDVLEPEVLAGMHQIAETLRHYEEVRRVDSLVELLSETRHILDAETPPGVYLPQTRAEAAQLALLLEGDTLDHFVTPEHDATRVDARLDTVPSVQATVIVAEVREVIASLADAPATFRITGPVYIFQRLVHEIIDSQVRSFGLAFILILLMMILTLRSVPLALLSMLPNSIPIVVMLGVLGWSDIPLNDVTIMTASVAIGIAVDDTIHYLFRFRMELSRGIGIHEAMERTIRGVGRAVVTTSIVLTAGFLVATLSSFNPPIYFGLLSAVTIVTALFADLVLLPVLLAGLGSRLRLGEPIDGPVLDKGQLAPR